MMEKNLKDEIRILQDERDKRIENLLDGQTAASDLVNVRGDKVDPQGPGAHAATCSRSCATPTS